MDADDAMVDVVVPTTSNPGVTLSGLFADHYLHLVRFARHRRSVTGGQAGGDGAEPADAPLLLAERRQRVLDAVANLPGRQREVVVLTYYLDLGIAGVAALLDISPSAVSSSLGRALTTLTRILGDDDA